jgi:hypothetical protein
MDIVRQLAQQSNLASLLGLHLVRKKKKKKKKRREN